MSLQLTKHLQIFLVLLATSGHARPPLLIHRASVGAVRWLFLELSGDEFMTLASCGQRPPALPVPGLIYLFGTTPGHHGHDDDAFQTTSPSDALPTRTYTAG
jgi:hypothetical protein